MAVEKTPTGVERGRPGRRRPSGEPPLPREDRWTRWIWVLAAVLLVGAALNVLIHMTDVVLSELCEEALASSAALGGSERVRIDVTDDLAV